MTIFSFVFQVSSLNPFSPNGMHQRLSGKHRSAYNVNHQRWHTIIMQNGGCCQSGSQFWYQGESMPDDLPAEFDEDAACPIVDHSHLSNRSPHDSLFTYCDADIDLISRQLGIPWEPSKTIPFSAIVPYLGFKWNLPDHTVALTENKKAKYRAAIRDWLPHPTHDLEETQKLYGKLLHASLEGLMGSFSTNPFVPHHAPCHTTTDLSWWLNALDSPRISHPIPGPALITDRGTFSDASSGVGIGIVISNCWCTWRLVPGWKADRRDIRWAEAVGFELLAHALCATSQPGQSFDNRGVVEGWWRGRSQNWETNKVFCCIHSIADTHQCTFITCYITSRENPADTPSRGLYPPLTCLLPAICIPDPLCQFVVDFDQ